MTHITTRARPAMPQHIDLSTVRAFMLIEAVTFGLAALTHFGYLLEGYAHREASIAESVIALVLAGGLALTWSPPPWARTSAIVAQGFALLGVCVGLFTIAVGVGPRTVLDVVYHLGIVVTLVVGLVFMLRDSDVAEAARSL